MRRFWPLLLFVIIFSVAVFSTQNTSTSEQINSDTPQRIISLAPSITETLFAVGAGPQVVGVTNFCDFPAAAQSLPKVGGYIDLNLEAVIALQPDLIILLANQQQVIEQLKQLNIPFLAVNNTTLSEIQDTISSIGLATQHQAEAKKITDKIRHQIEIIEAKTADKPKPRVMIAMGHSIGNEHVKQVFIAGNQDFYNDLIIQAGGVNAYQGTQLKVPSLSTEGIMALNPEIIIDIFPEADDHLTDLNDAKQRWHNLHYVDAIKNNRVHIIEESYATIAGPRIFLLLQQIAHLIHPEIDWQTTPL